MQGQRGPTLNSAVADYNSWSGAGGRSYTTPPATSSVTVRAATVTKIQNAPGNAAAIGQPFYYTLGVNVPIRTTVYNTTASDTIPDGLEVDSTATYVDGIPQTIGTVTVTPNPGDGTTAIAWDIGDYTNITSATQQLQLRVNVHIKTTYHDSTPVSGLPPQATFANTANIGWDDANTGGSHHTASGSATDVTATEPHLVLTKSNDAAGPVAGGQPVHYTVTATNTGTSASYKNVLVDTLPAGMRGNTPSVTSVTLGGSFLTAGANYTVNWDPGTGALTVDLTAGSAGADQHPAGPGQPAGRELHRQRRQRNRGRGHPVQPGLHRLQLLVRLQRQADQQDHGPRRRQHEDIVHHYPVGHRRQVAERPGQRREHRQHLRLHGNGDGPGANDHLQRAGHRHRPRRPHRDRGHHGRRAMPTIRRTPTGPPG